MIELFHTSPQKITEPDTRHSRTNLDFGRGFYLTSFKDQAIRYAGRFSDRYDTIWMNTYALKEDWTGWKVAIFDSYDEKWLDFVTACRMEQDNSDYDMVVGGVADDRVFETIDLYFAGLMPKEIALERLAFIHPNIQYCIRSEQMLHDCLTYKSSIKL